LKKVFKEVLRAITLVLDILYRVFLEFSKVILLITVLVVSAQVILRTFTRHSILWSEEIALLLMVWLAFIAMAIGVEKAMHISVGLFFNKFPKWLKTGATKLNDVLTAGFGFALIYFGILLISSTATSTLPATKLPSCWKYMMIPISGVFITYFSLMNLFNLNWLRHDKILKGNDEDV
jgi:TRAP-type transport system small permease protein